MTDNKKILVTLSAMALLAVSAPASAVRVTFMGPDTVDPNVQNTLTIDAVITDVGALSFYSSYDLTVELYPVIGGNGTFSGVENVTGESDYVFAGTSANYSGSVGSAVLASASDATSVPEGVPATLDNPLVARFVIDLSGLGIGNQFAISLCDLGPGCIDTNSWEGFDDSGIFRVEDFVADDLVITLAPAVVPVPAGLWLFASALSLMGWARRRSA